MQATVLLLEATVLRPGDAVLELPNRVVPELLTLPGAPPMRGGSLRAIGECVPGDIGLGPGLGLRPGLGDRFAPGFGGASSSTPSATSSALAAY